LAASLLAVLLVHAGCSRKAKVESPTPVQALLPADYVDTTVVFPTLRFRDGTVSLNDRCPVRKVKLNPRLQPLFVNGRPIGFC